MLQPPPVKFILTHFRVIKNPGKCMSEINFTMLKPKSQNFNLSLNQEKSVSYFLSKIVHFVLKTYINTICFIFVISLLYLLLISNYHQIYIFTLSLIIGCYIILVINPDRSWRPVRIKRSCTIRLRPGSHLFPFLFVWPGWHRFYAACPFH